MSKRIIILFSFFVFWLFFFPTNNVIPNVTYNGWVKNLMIIFMFLYFRNDISRYFSKRYRWLNLSVLAYAIICVISILLNADSISYYTTTQLRDGVMTTFEGVQSTKSTIYFSLSTIVLLLFVERLTLENKVKLFIGYFWKMLFLLWIWVNVDAITHVVVNEKIGGYIIGNKFHVCYYNLLTCTLYYYRHMGLTKIKEKAALLFLVIVMLTNSLHTQCSTMVAGTMAFFLGVFILPKKYWNKLSAPSLLVSLLVIVDLGFFFFTTWVLQFTIVQDFIVDVLHEDLTLTGRLGIFENISESFSTSMWLGFGNGNSGVVSMFYTGVQNPQNGLIEVFLNVGIVGCMAFLSWLYFAAKEITERDKYKYPLVVYILTMIIISTIEAPFDKTFMFVMILLAAGQNNLIINQNDLYGKKSS